MLNKIWYLLIILLQKLEERRPVSGSISYIRDSNGRWITDSYGEPFEDNAASE